MLPLLADTADIGKNLGVTFLFILIGAAALIGAHLLFHIVVKKFTHGSDVQDLLTSLFSSAPQTLDQPRAIALLGACIVYGLSELAFVGGIALIIAHVAS